MTYWRNYQKLSNLFLNSKFLVGALCQAIVLFCPTENEEKNFKMSKEKGGGGLDPPTYDYYT